MKFHISYIKTTDYQQIISLWKKQPGIGINNKDDSFKGFIQFLKKNQKTCYVVKANDEIIGTLLAGYDGRRVTLYHVMIDQHYQRQGLGKMLVHHAINQFKQMNITKINLVVYKNNHDGNAFWESLNFKIRDDLYYRDLKL